MNDIKALKALKNKILSLAMQGKLVKQNENDEPASVLLEKIRLEKETLLKQGKLKKEKPLPQINADEVPYELPNSWQWVRLGEVFIIERGSSPRPISQYVTDDINGINWIKIGDAAKGSKYITHTKEKITQDGAAKSRFVEIGDLIFSNSMSYGRPYILKINGCIHDGWNVLRPIYIKNNNTIISINQNFIYYAIASTLLQNQIRFEANGGIVENIKSDNLKQVYFPLPPLAEQERIVVKIEEIFAIIDEVEKNITENKKISKILYNRLLSHAMQGKLVKHNENDEPASVLLEKIRLEKETLLKQGKLKQEKPLPPINADEVPYELPNSWQWVRLGEVCEIIKREKSDNINLPLMDVKYLRTKENPKIYNSGIIVYKNELIILVDGENSGEVFTVFEQGILGSTLNILDVSINVNTKYILFILSYFKDMFRNSKKGAAIPHLDKNLFKNLPVPLPPLAEQERIVAKIEEIKEIIDEIG